MRILLLAAAVQLRGGEEEQPTLLNEPPAHEAAAHGDAHGAGRGARLREAAAAAHASAEAHSEHEAHGEHKAHGEPTDDCGASSVAVGLFSTVALVPFVFTLVQSGGVTAKLTWRFIDFFVSVFLAILWFGAFSDVLVLQESHIGPMTMALIQVAILYGLALFFAHYLKDNIFRLVTFASCGAHYIAFAGIAAGEHTQRAHFSDVEWKTFLFAGLALVVLGAVFVVAYRFRAGVKGEYNHAIDELEIDIAGLVGSYLITQSVRTALTGHYPAPHLLQFGHEPADDAGHGGEVDNGHDSEGHQIHTANQRALMLGWAILLVVASVVLVPMVQVWGHHAAQGPQLGAGHLPPGWKHKFAHFVKILLIMCASWAFLLWGEWEFHVMFHGDPLFGHMVFALMATVSCLFIVLAVGKVCKNSSEPILRAAETSCTGLALVAAWAWEHCFDMALGVLGRKYQVGYGGLVPKIGLALLIPCFVLPVYINFVKPKVLEGEHEDEEKEERRAVVH